MSPTLYRDTGYSLTHLIGDISHGNIALPDIQRPFVWKASKVRDLFDSMYRGFPVGTLMFWETGAEVGTRQIGDAEGRRVAKLLIVDGQQRLTGLYAVIAGVEVLNDKFEYRRIRLAFRPSDETFDVADAAVENNPEYVSDITTLWEGSYKSVVRDFFARLGESRGAPLSNEEQDLLDDRIDRVRDLQNFRFQVIELNAEADEEQVAEIFVRINSEGVKLNQSDFILTLMSVHWEKGRRQLEEFCRQAVDPAVTGPSPRNPFLDPSPDQLLRAAVGLGFRRGRLRHAYSLLRGKDLETGEVTPERRDEQFAILKDAQDAVLDLTNWHEFLKCLMHAGFRSRRMITSETAIIYTYILWLTGKRDFGVDHQRLRSVIARWFFMAQTTGRYTSSPESQIESDLQRIAALPTGDAGAFCDELDRIIRANFTRDYWDISLPNKLDSSAARAPGLYAYWAALILLDAELLFSEMRVRDVLTTADQAHRAVERHHLFPRKYLESVGITDTKQINAIGNMSFTDWTENAGISDSPPLEYWPVMSSRLNEDRLRRQKYWHALPVGWEQLDYPAFLERRRELIAIVIRDGFNTLWDTPQEPATASEITDLLAAGESQTVEFKSTARWNLKAGLQDKKIEHVIVKTVGGFLNAEGGVLVIGAADDGAIVGLEHDLATLNAKPDLDGFELWLRQHLDANLSVPTAALVRIAFEHAKDKEICLVHVGTAARPVFAKPADGGKDPIDFWVRVGNLTRQLHGDDLVTYKDDHWG
jgi:hypothetical protein